MNVNYAKHCYNEALANSLVNPKVDLKFLETYNKLMGLEIAFGTTEYGFIVSFKEIIERHSKYTYAITNKGFEFECEQLMYIIKIIELKAAGKEIVYPQGSDYAMAWTQPKPKRRVKVMDGSAFIHPSQTDYYTNGKKGK